MRRVHMLRMSNPLLHNMLPVLILVVDEVDVSLCFPGLVEATQHDGGGAEGCYRHGRLPHHPDALQPALPENTSRHPYLR